MKKCLTIGVALVSIYCIQLTDALVRLIPCKCTAGTVSPDFLKNLKENFKSEIFVETGTYYGGTARTAAGIFDKVYTIELSKLLYETAKHNLIDCKNVAVYNGDSAKLLPIIIKFLKKQSAIFWLDAHFSGGTTAQGKQNTPILSEVKTIISTCKNAIILIDDMRFFQPDDIVNATFNETKDDAIFGYPTLQELVSQLNKGYQFYLLGDVGLIYSCEAFPNIQVSELVKAITAERLSIVAADNNKYKKILESEHKIICSNEKEGEIFLTLINPQFGTSYPARYTAIYKIWGGLYLLGQKKYKQAIDCFNLALKTGYSDWRIYYYLSVAFYASGLVNEAKNYLNSIQNKYQIYGLPNAKLFFEEIQNSRISY